MQCVMHEYPEARMAYGESDEYSFILHKDTQLYGAWRRLLTVQ
jgi:tRNA(His) 5'-end guanylyltransferase